MLSSWIDVRSKTSILAGLVCFLVTSGAAVAGGSSKDAPDERWSGAGGFYVEGRIGGPVNSEYDVNMVSPNVAGANGTLGIDGTEGIGVALSIGKQVSRLWRAVVAADALRVPWFAVPTKW